MQTLCPRAWCDSYSMNSVLFHTLPCCCAQVSFQAAHTLAAVRVAAVTATSDGQPVRYASKSVLLTDDYHVA